MSFEPERKIRKTKLIASVVRAARVLKAFSRERPEMGISELAHVLDLPPSSVYRLVASLESEDLVEQDPTSGRYRLSLEMFLIGSQVLEQMGLGETALPPLRRLSEHSGETVNMGALRNGAVVYLHKVDSRNVLKASFTLGDQAPAHCTAIGKVLLAYLSESELEAWLRQQILDRWGPHTITDPRLLREELRRTQERGYSVDDEELAPNTRCLGAPVRDYVGQVVAAVSISGPSQRMTPERMTELLPPLLETALQVSQRMGYREKAA